MLGDEGTGGMILYRRETDVAENGVEVLTVNGLIESSIISAVNEWT